MNMMNSGAFDSEMDSRVVEEDGLVIKSEGPVKVSEISRYRSKGHYRSFFRP